MSDPRLNVTPIFLRISEACRGLSAPASCRGLLIDCARLIDVPLDAYGAFIDDYVTRMAEIPEILAWAVGPIEVEPVTLDLDGDDEVMERFFARLREIEEA